MKSRVNSPVWLEGKRNFLTLIVLAPLYLMNYNNLPMAAQPHLLPDSLMTQVEAISKQLINSIIRLASQVKLSSFLVFFLLENWYFSPSASSCSCSLFFQNSLRFGLFTAVLHIPTKAKTKHNLTNFQGLIQNFAGFIDYFGRRINIQKKQFFLLLNTAYLCFQSSLLVSVGFCRLCTCARQVIFIL